MANRKPLVIVDGQIRQLSASDVLDAQLNEVDFVSITNGEATAVVIGTPVYVFGSGSVKKAFADDIATAEVLGLIYDISVAASDPGRVLTDGRLTATTGQWDAITGQTGGLTPGEIYFLDSASAGKLTITAPVADTEVVIKVGKAISATVFEISIGQTILL